VVAGVLGDLDPPGQDRHLHRRREVGGPEDDRLEPGGGGADLVHVDEAAGGLDLGLDADVAGPQPRVLLHLGQQQVEGDDLRRGLHLRQHDLVETLAGAPDDLDDVTVCPLGVPSVHANAQHAVVPRQVLDGVDHLGPGPDLFEGGDRVLEVEERHVGRHGGRLGQKLLVGAGCREA
jgi:hypothetical protein